MRRFITITVALLAAYGVFFAEPEQMRAIFTSIICVNVFHNIKD